MPEIDENRKVQKISRLLEKGGTMLATHHECGAPLFRYQGKIVCPVCDFPDRPQEPEKRTAEEVPKKPAIKAEVRTSPAGKAADYSEIVALVKNKVHSIATGLEGETDLHRVKEKMECIELGIRILKLLEF